MVLLAVAVVLVIAVLHGQSLVVSTPYSGAGTKREFYKARDAITEPAYSRYQYIIVGGGTAGCALATTLSEHYRVLVLERGGTPYGNPRIERLEGWGDLLDTVYSNKTSEPCPVQAFRSADGVYNRRARVLGGGSAINAGFYSRAKNSAVRAAGWDASLVEESYQWIEDRIVHQSRIKEWQTALRNGLLEAGVIPNNGRTYNHVVGTKVGASIFDAQGRRHSAADLLSFANDELLTVLTFANVHRIVFDVLDHIKSPRAKGVEYTDSKGILHVALLEDGIESEVILSAGALGSPQLLLLSGVGPCQHLLEFNITCVVDLNAVGANMVDNPINAIIIPSPRPVEISLISVVGITAEGIIIEGASGGNWSWQWPGMGELNILSPSSRTQEAIASIQTKLSNLPDNIRQQVDQSGFVLAKVYSPKSHGYLRLDSTNVSENPYVVFNYYSDSQDIQTCIKGISSMQKLLRSQAFQGFRFVEVTPLVALLYPSLSASVGKRFDGAYLPNTQNESESAEWCRDTVTTIWHFHGGCSLGKVVDRDYRVIGLKSVRVVDGSTFTSSPEPTRKLQS